MKMQQRVLNCKKCEAELTFPLVAITDISEMKALCQFVVGEPVLPKGRFLMLPKDTDIISGKMVECRIRANEAWIHLDDIAKGVGFTHYARRLAGCCGVSGCDGPNRVCRCGEHVGTQYSDCYEHHAFLSEPKTTRWKNVNRSEERK